MKNKKNSEDVLCIRNKNKLFNSIHKHGVRILFSLYYNVKQYVCTVGNVTDVWNSVLLPMANWPKNLSFMR